MPMHNAQILNIANTLSNTDIVALINVLSDRLFVVIDDCQGQFDSLTIRTVTGACCNGAMVQIEIEE